MAEKNDRNEKKANRFAAVVDAIQEDKTGDGAEAGKPKVAKRDAASGYHVIKGYVPEPLYLDVKSKCARKKLEISEVLETLLTEWNERN